MPTYIVERYRPSSDPESVRSVAERLTASAQHASDDGVSVRYIDTIFLPGDETCLHLFEADSEAEVQAVARQAGIVVDRIVPAEQIEPGEIGHKVRVPEKEEES